MATWFECKVKYEKLTENGQQKAVTEPYLVDALSFTEAEARIIEEMTPFVTGGELKVTAVKRTNIAEIFWDEEGDMWYKVKVNFVSTGFFRERPFMFTFKSAISIVLC